MRRIVFDPMRGRTRATPGNISYTSSLQPDEKGEYRAYNESTNVITDGGPVTVEDGCFAVMYTNVGCDVCYVNGKVLFPGQTALPRVRLGDSFSVSGHLRDLYYGVINVKFDTAVDPALEIIQLFYVGMLKDRELKGK